MNTRGFAPILVLLIGAGVVLAGGAYFWFTAEEENGNTNTTNIVYEQNTNVMVNAQVNANVNAQVNTNTSIENTNSTSSGRLRSITVSEALTNPTAYDETDICITGAYQESFEFMAFGNNFRDDTNGNRTLTSPYIWVETGGIPESSLTCTTSGVGQKTCTGEVTTCGTFRYAASGEEGMGHVRAYRYGIFKAFDTGSNSLNAQ